MIEYIVFGISIFMLCAFGLAALAAERRYQSLPKLPTTTAMPVASVQILIPARNESGNIARVTTSLMKQNYPQYALTVIDDHSEDDTGTIAQKIGADVLRLESEPPPGWTGKCNACEQGVRVTSSELILFTD